MTTRKTVWVVLADGEHARVVSPLPERTRFKTSLSFDSVAAHHGGDRIAPDRPGRSFESGGTLRHAITPKEDPHQAAKHDFLLQVARQIDGYAKNGAFDQLVLVAPAHALHDLQAALGAEAAKLVAGSLAKDLTRVPDIGLSDHLAEWWVPSQAS